MISFAGTGFFGADDSRSDFRNLRSFFRGLGFSFSVSWFISITSSDFDSIHRFASRSWRIFISVVFGLMIILTPLFSFLKKGVQFRMIMCSICGCFFLRFSFLRFVSTLFSWPIEWRKFDQFLFVILWTLWLDIRLFLDQNLRLFFISRLCWFFIFVSTWVLIFSPFFEIVEISHQSFDLFDVWFLNREVDFIVELVSSESRKLNGGSIYCRKDGEKGEQEETSQNVFPHRI